MKKFALLSLLLTFGMPMAFAHEHTPTSADCNCQRECKEKCAKGDTKDCKCESKSCDCKETKTCH